MLSLSQDKGFFDNWPNNPALPQLARSESYSDGEVDRSQPFGLCVIVLASSQEELHLGPNWLSYPASPPIPQLAQQESDSDSGVEERLPPQSSPPAALSNVQSPDEASGELERLLEQRRAIDLAIEHAQQGSRSVFKTLLLCYS